MHHHLRSMKKFMALAALSITAQAPAQNVATVRQQGVPQVGVPQIGNPAAGVPQIGVPQRGVVMPSRPQANPDGSPPRVVGWHAPYTVIVGDGGSDYIPYPGQFNLPNPAYGLAWRRVGNDAILYDIGQGSILEVRRRWFG